MDTKEWARNGSFMKKPTSGWLHDDAALQEGDGIYYPVKYVGAIPVDLSMRTMRFDERTEVTREAISLVCEAAGIRQPVRRKVSKLVRQSLSGDPRPYMYNVKLTISTTGIALVIVETNQVIANHIMPCISFATGCDAVDYDVIGYVAKDARNVRECHVFDCGHLAPDIMATIGQAFELRYKAFLRKGSAPQQQSRALPSVPAQQAYGDFTVPYEMAEGYGDVPTSGQYGEIPAYGSSDLPEPTYGEIDDFNNPSRGVYDNGPNSGEVLYETAENVGIGGVNFETRGYDRAGQGDYDDVLTMNEQGGDLVQAPGGPELERPLMEETWFHGQLSRDTADDMLGPEGSFLVRENISCPGQYILSSMSAGQPQHLLLVDPSGRVRTKDMSFNSVSHLINYHLRGRLPIISANTRIMLGQPVVRVQSGHSYNTLPK